MEKNEYMTEISVHVKDDERKYKRDFVSYAKYSCTEDDPVIKDCIDVTLAEFKGDPESIIVKISLQVR